MNTAMIVRSQLHIDSRCYDLTRIRPAYRSRIETILNSESIQKRIEIDEGVVVIHFAPKAKEVGAAPIEIAPIPPAPAIPPVVEIPAPKTRPGTRFINGVIDYGSVGVAPIFREAWYLEMTKK